MLKLFVLFGSLCVSSPYDTNQVFCRDFWYPESVSLEECENLMIKHSLSLKKQAKINNLEIKTLEYQCIPSQESRG